MMANAHDHPDGCASRARRRCLANRVTIAVAFALSTYALGGLAARGGAPVKPGRVDGDQTLPITDAHRQFWSFRSLRRAALPDVRDASWCRTPIDHFVLARLEEKGLAPNRPVDRRRLIRRAYFDVVGLPPTPQEIDAFVNDPDADAYARLVDRLLDSPRYGERWGRHWLDVARFAESHGFEQDYDRPYAYHFRDFVIRALNEDMPYDQFVRWQLAGDELAPDDPQALMATGFLGAGVFPTQITANEVEPSRYDALDDMVNTMGTAMLGLTLGCARCHDHKYDPISTHDYYRLISTFTTTVRSNIELDLDPEVYRKAKAQFDKTHAPKVAALRAFETERLPERFDRWLTGDRKNKVAASGWIALDLVEYRSESGAPFTRLDDGSLLAKETNADFDTYTLVAHTNLKGISAFRLEALSHDSLPKKGPGRAENGGFALSAFRVTARPLRGGGEPITVKLVNPRATFETKELPVKAALDGKEKTAWGVDPKVGEDHAVVFEAEKALGFDGGTVLTVTLKFEKSKGHGIGRPRLSITTAPETPDLRAAATPQPLAEIAAIEQSGMSDEARKASLRKWYRRLDPEWRKLDQAVQDHLQRVPRPKLTKVMVCSEGFKPIRHHTQGADFFEVTYFLKRGDTKQKLGVATPGFPRVLVNTPEAERHWQVEPPDGWRTSYRRTALANWITDTECGPGHLLARVIVNRLWQHHFGRGLVATPSDFGVQGERPTHPELLDWLATELIRHGWRLKPMHKLIMTSAVYMQSMQYDPAKSRIDPGNRLCWRRTPRRLEAEVVRDSILAVSGRLDTRMFGPGTLDESHTRRSIYFMIKRSKLIGMMQLFDAPEPTVGIGRRASTTIAPQALMLMNNTNVRRCATAFAERLVADCGSRVADCGLEDLVAAGYRTALGRSPNETELNDSLAFIRQQAQSYEAGGKGDAQTLALSDLCQVLMGLNEFVYTE